MTARQSVRELPCDHVDQEAAAGRNLDCSDESDKNWEDEEDRENWKDDR